MSEMRIVIYGMHKSSVHSDKDCVWNEDAPTVISCALFRTSEVCGHLIRSGSLHSATHYWDERNANENTSFI